MVCFTFHPVWFHCRGFRAFGPVSSSNKLRLSVHAASRSLWRHCDVGHHCVVILIKAGFDWPCWLMTGLWPSERVYVQNRTAPIRRWAVFAPPCANREIPQKHKAIRQQRCLCWRALLLSRTDDSCPYQYSYKEKSHQLWHYSTLAYTAQWNVSEMCIDPKRLGFSWAGTAAIIAEVELVNGRFGFLEGSAQQSFYATFYASNSVPYRLIKMTIHSWFMTSQTPLGDGAFHSKTITL